MNIRLIHCVFGFPSHNNNLSISNTVEHNVYENTSVVTNWSCNLSHSHIWLMITQRTRRDRWYECVSVCMYIGVNKNYAARQMPVINSCALSTAIVAVITSVLTLPTYSSHGDGSKYMGRLIHRAKLSICSHVAAICSQTTPTSSSKSSPLALLTCISRLPHGRVWKWKPHNTHTHTQLITLWNGVGCRLTAPHVSDMSVGISEWKWHFESAEQLHRKMTRGPYQMWRWWCGAYTACLFASAIIGDTI